MSLYSGRGERHFPAVSEFWKFIGLLLSGGSFPGGFLSLLLRWVLSHRPRRPPLQGSAALSLCSSHFSSALSTNSSHLDLSELQSLFPQLGVASRWNCRTHFVFSLSLSNYRPTLSVVQYLKTIVFCLYFVQISCLRWKCKFNSYYVLTARNRNLWGNILNIEAWIPSQDALGADLSIF